MPFRNEHRLRTSGSLKRTGDSQEETTDPFSIPHSSKDGITYESDVELMDETLSTIDDQGFGNVKYRHSVRVTGASPINDDVGYDKQEITVSMGSIACIRSLENPASWRGEKQGEPNLFYLKQDDQGLYQTDFLDSNTVDSNTMRVGFVIHQTIDPYLNGRFSIYRDDSTKSIRTLETIVNFVKKDVNPPLNDMPESVVLVRCDFPFYASVDPERRVVAEHIVIEYFRSPWSPYWRSRVRRATVRDTGPWYESLTKDEAFPDGSSVEEENAAFTNESPAQVEDEAFLDGSVLHDSPLNGHDSQLPQTTTTFLFDALRPRTEVSFPSYEDWMDFIMQSLLTLDGSWHTSLIQPSDVAHPSGVRTTKAKSKPTKASKTTNKHEETSKPKSARKAETKRPKIYECRFPGCTKAYTTQYSLTSHTNSQHGDIRYQCLFCSKTYSRYGDCARHEDTKHRVKIWKCKWCPKKYTRRPSAKQREGCQNGRPRHRIKMMFLNPYVGLS
ncbi:hypothetical protein BGZ90_001750 [Linnemannia elongata]|nr:hypothetical protein BGZ90_001750 [Linnemannia elongata]